MAKLRIKGSFATTSTPAKLDDILIEGDCQTCGGTFDISIPFDMTAAAGTALQHVRSTATTDPTGARNIKVS
jgi:hypothetical protein